MNGIGAVKYIISQTRQNRGEFAAKVNVFAELS